ncbi:MAG: hypothetical protein Q9167_002272 [Letrouitia subvulpina]
MSSLSKIALDLLANGPLKSEKTSRRVRSIFDRIWIFDTTQARHVWEHPYYPQYYVPSQVVTPGLLSKNDPVDKDGSAFFATLKGSTKSTDRVLVFEKGALEGLVRFEFSALDSWYEEDQPIYQHPKDPYKRIDILPSTRKITVKIDDVVIAESTLNMFLFETMLRARFYMPKTALASMQPATCTLEEQENFVRVDRAVLPDNFPSCIFTPCCLDTEPESSPRLRDENEERDESFIRGSRGGVLGVLHGLEQTFQSTA